MGVPKNKLSSLTKFGGTETDTANFAQYLMEYQKINYPTSREHPQTLGKTDIFRTSPFKVTNEDTLFQCYHPDLFAQILGFLKVEVTNLRSKFHHLERASPNFIGALPLQCGYFFNWNSL